MNTGYKILSELSEDQIEADVASYLGYITPFWSERFQLRRVDEQETGSDKLFDRFIPIYLQFKVSEGLKPLQTRFSLTSPYFPLQKIRRFRKSRNINTDPILYFRLRNKAKTAYDFQHNILRSLHKPPYQYALYVAPLALTIDEYNDSLKVSFFDRYFTFDPFVFRHERLITRTIRKSLGLTPFLRGHISIAPHVDVTTSEHYYSFSKSGGKLAWHSGEKIPGDHRFSSWLNQIYQAGYYGDYSINKEQYVEFMEEFTAKFDLPRVSNINENIDFRIQNFSRILKTEFNITTMFLETNVSH